MRRLALSIALAAPALVLIPSAAAETQSRCERTFTNGEAIAGGFAPGGFLPELTVHNGPRDHAIVKLESVATGKTHFYFVERDDTAVIRWIEPGEYRVAYASGAILASDCTTITHARAVVQFTDPFDLYKTETVEPGGRIYTEVGSNWVTLFAQSEGNAEGKNLSLSEFNR